MKRKWKTSKGNECEAWVVDYVDQQGRRILKTFDKKKDADTFAASSRVEVIEGTHVAEPASVTVAEAGDLWIRSAEASDPPLERTPPSSNISSTFGFTSCRSSDGRNYQSSTGRLCAPSQIVFSL